MIKKAGSTFVQKHLTRVEDPNNVGLCSHSATIPRSLIGNHFSLPTMEPKGVGSSSPRGTQIASVSLRYSLSMFRKRSSYYDCLGVN